MSNYKGARFQSGGGVGVVTFLEVLRTVGAFRAGGVEHGLTGGLWLLWGVLVDVEGGFFTKTNIVFFPLLVTEEVCLGLLMTLEDLFFFFFYGVKSAGWTLKVLMIASH